MRPRAACSRRSARSSQFNQNIVTFNSFNALILKGDAPPGMELTYATLMARDDLLDRDEPDACYGLAARAVRISADGLTCTFLLRPEAKFHDGTR